MTSKLELIDNLADMFEDEAVFNEVNADMWREEYGKYELDIPEFNYVEYF